MSEGMELSRSIGAVLAEPGGALLVALVTTDQESFWTSLTPLPDISVPATDLPSGEIYSVAAWLTSLDRRADGALFACDADGHVHTNASGAWAVEPVCPGRGLMVVRCLADGSVLAAGTSGVVYRRGEVGWEALGESLGVWLLGLEGAAAERFVDCGDEGLVATRDEHGWHKTTLEGATSLNAVLATPEGYLVGGRGGALYRGERDRWVAIPGVQGGGADAGGEPIHVHGLARGADAIWVACGAAGAGRIDADGALRIVWATFAPTSVHAAGPYAAFGAGRIVARTDGTTWLGRVYG